MELKYDENFSPLEKQILKNTKIKETIFILIESGKKWETRVAKTKNINLDYLL